MNTPVQIQGSDSFWATCKTQCLGKSARAKWSRQFQNTIRNIVALPAFGWLLAAAVFFFGGPIALIVCLEINASL
jgi:hypothetical protein